MQKNENQKTNLIFYLVLGIAFICLFIIISKPVLIVYRCFHKFVTRLRWESSVRSKTKLPLHRPEFRPILSLRFFAEDLHREERKRFPPNVINISATIS